MKITDNFLVKCNECKNKMELDKEDFEYDTSYNNGRGMGTEVLHHFTGVYNCDTCNNEMTVEITGSEYPSRAKNSQHFDIKGGEFIQEPNVEIVHEKEDLIN